MSLLTDADFPAFFEAVHGRSPFAWQSELAEQVVRSGQWPTALDVPTGLGKTAALDVAVFALATQAHLPTAERTAPTRTFLVVDRKVIVDQAHERAETIVRALARPNGEIVERVAAALLTLLPNGERPLVAVRMRGGLTWESRWLASAAQPAIVTGTVDQLGSRLLFRGYGTSDRMKPIDAALCGTDSLLLLDEAHLSQAFLSTAAAVQRYEALAQQAPMDRRRSHTVLLSATLPTPTDGSLAAPFRCDPTKETSSAAVARLNAVKNTRLLDVKARGELAPVLAALAGDAIASGVERTGVLCNTVALARQVYEALESHANVDRVLLIGRCRELERDRVVERWVRGHLAAVEERSSSRPVVVVATQTVEVGADIDLDHLITEACPLDALTQRLGRLNRLGRVAVAEAVVVHDAAVHDQQDQTPVYGAATQRTWEWLVENAGQPVTVSPGKAVGALADAPPLDLGPIGVLSRLSSSERAALAAASAATPVVLSPIIEMWGRTAPIPVPDQDVAPYLHGLQSPRAEVQVCWRAGLVGTANREMREEELRLAPPLAHELVAVSFAEARRLMLHRAGASRESDAEGAWDTDDEDPFAESEPIPGWVLAADGSLRDLNARSLRPGSIVVLDSSVGGHDEWGWTGELDGRVVPDVADLSDRGPQRVRLREGIWAALVGWPTALEWPSAGDTDRQTVLDVLRDLDAVLHDRDVSPDSPERRALQPFVDSLDGARLEGRHSLYLSRPRLRAGLRGADDMGAASPASSSIARGPIGLDRHLRDVRRRAGDEGRSLGLSGDLVRALELAGLAHDLGKADERFQLILHGGRRYRLELAAEPLAKSQFAQNAAERRSVRELSGWPSGMRHESISAAAVVALQKQRPELFDGVDADLVLHLVASHHGHSRPLLPPVVDDQPRTTSLTLPATDTSADATVVTVSSDDLLVDWTHPGRFDRLREHYGSWGLALLEAVLRLADMAESEAYDKEVAR